MIKIKKFLTYKGRANRKEFAIFSYLSILLSIIHVFIIIDYFEKFLGELGTFIACYSVLSIIYVLCMFITIRRLHDINKSGWWALITFIPYIGPLVFVYLLFAKGTIGINYYGEPTNS